MLPFISVVAVVRSDRTRIEDTTEGMMGFGERDREVIRQTFSKKQYAVIVGSISSRVGTRSRGQSAFVF